jgi:hypothetical protein
MAQVAMAKPAAKPPAAAPVSKPKPKPKPALTSAALGGSGTTAEKLHYFECCSRIGAVPADAGAAGIGAERADVEAYAVHPR